MGAPTQPITLSVEQIENLNARLARLRHDINNNLSLMIAAVELVRYKPEMADRMMTTLAEQPPRIGQAMAAFTTEFERTLGIIR